MPIKVIKQEPQSQTVLWKDVQIGDVYRSGGLLVLAVQPLEGNIPRAAALEVSEDSISAVGDIWQPGERSGWTPMLTTMTVSPVNEN